MDDVDVATLLDDDRLALVEGRRLRWEAPEAALERVCAALRRVLGCSAASVTVVGAEQTTVASDGLELPADLVTVPLEESFCARALVAGQPLAIRDARAHPWAASTELARRGVVVAYLGIPLRSRDGHGIGALCGFWDQAHAWTEDEIDLAEELAGWAAAELELHRKEEELVEAVEAVDGHRRVTTSAGVDALTGLATVGWLDARLDDWLRDGEATLVVCEVDAVAQVNDVFGRAVGDAVLRRLSGQVRQTAPPGACVARLGGEAFAVAVPDGDLAVGERIGEALRAAAVLPVGSDVDGAVAGRASVGVAASTGVTVEADERASTALLDAAWVAAAAARRASGSVVVRYEGRLRAAAERERLVERELRRAIHAFQRGSPSDGRLSLVYQPTYRLDDDGGVVGVEALARFDHPDLGTVPPGEFVPLAERRGLMVLLGAALLALAAEQRRAWHRDGVDPGVLWVNVSARQLDDGLVAELVALASEAGAALGVEVTETALLDGERTVERLAELRRHNVRVAIDDVGTGYSSLSALAELPCDVIKVDRSFVDAVEGDPLAAAIVAAVVSVGAALGADVVTEGLETEGQLRALRALGCRQGAGYLLARPAPDGPALRASMTGPHRLLAERPAGG